MALGAAEHHHLGADAAGRLEQHRIHLDARQQAAGFGLDGLGARHLAAVERDPGVVGHVLRLERGDAHALAVQPGAECRGHPGFAGTRAGAEDPDCFHARCSCPAAPNRLDTALLAAAIGPDQTTRPVSITAARSPTRAAR